MPKRTIFLLLSVGLVASATAQDFVIDGLSIDGGPMSVDFTEIVWVEAGAEIHFLGHGPAEATLVYHVDDPILMQTHQETVVTDAGGAFSYPALPFNPIIMPENTFLTYMFSNGQMITFCSIELPTGTVFSNFSVYQEAILETREPQEIELDEDLQEYIRYLQSENNGGTPEEFDWAALQRGAEMMEEGAIDDFLAQVQRMRESQAWNWVTYGYEGATCGVGIAIAASSGGVGVPVAVGMCSPLLAHAGNDVSHYFIGVLEDEGVVSYSEAEVMRGATEIYYAAAGLTGSLVAGPGHAALTTIDIVLAVDSAAAGAGQIISATRLFDSDGNLYVKSIWEVDGSQFTLITYPVYDYSSALTYEMEVAHDVQVPGGPVSVTIEVSDVQGERQSHLFIEGRIVDSSGTIYDRRLMAFSDFSTSYYNHGFRAPATPGQYLLELDVYYDGLNKIETDGVPLTVVEPVAGSLSLSASPNPCPEGGMSLVRATLVDDGGQPVAGRVVEFGDDLPGTYSGGDVASGKATTDFAGVAQVYFTPTGGAGSSGQLTANLELQPEISTTLSYSVSNGDDVGGEPPLADTYISMQYSDQNYGTEEGLVVGKVSAGPGLWYSNYAFLKFDLSGIDLDNVGQATLTLRPTGHTGDRCHLAVRRLLTPWSEYISSFNDGPYDWDLVSGDFVSYYDADEPLVFDVEDIVEDWLGGDPNHGFVVYTTQDDDDLFTFGSRESSSPPTLEIMVCDGGHELSVSSALADGGAGVSPYSVGQSVNWSVDITNTGGGCVENLDVEYCLAGQPGVFGNVVGEDGVGFLGGFSSEDEDFDYSFVAADAGTRYLNVRVLLDGIVECTSSSGPFEVHGESDIELSAELLEFREPYGVSGPLTQTIQVLDTAGQGLQWELGPNPIDTWLTVEPTSGTTPTTVTITVDPSDFSAQHCIGSMIDFVNADQWWDQDRLTVRVLLTSDDPLLEYWVLGYPLLDGVLDLGSVYVDDTESVEISVANVGVVPMEFVGSPCVTLMEGNPDFSIVSYPDCTLPATPECEPWSRTSVVIEYTPSSIGPDVEMLRMETVDGQVLEIQLIAEAWRQGEILHVSGELGSDDTGDGTAGNPFATIAQGLLEAAGYDTVAVAPGIYHEHDLQLKDGVVVRGLGESAADVVVHAQDAGRGFEAFGLTAAGFTLENLSITRAVAMSPVYDHDGAGLYMENSDGLIKNCLFFENVALSSGSAIHHEGPGSLTLENCTVVTSLLADPAIYIGEGVVGYLQNCLLSLNDETPVDGPGSVVMTCSNVWGNLDEDWTGLLAGLETSGGNVSVDPQFCDSSNRDFFLFGSSPCLPGGDHGCGLIGALGTGCSYTGPVWHVSTNGDDTNGSGTEGRPFATIARASAAASPGDTIKVQRGTYEPQGTSLADGLVIVGDRERPDYVILSGMGTTGIFEMVDLDLGVQVMDLTMTNARGVQGGAVRAENSVVEFTRCRFMNNVSDTDGGAIRADGGELALNECLFRGNSAAAGGGAVMVAGDGTAVAADCVFTENSAVSGGAIATGELAGTSLIGCQLDGNTATRGGAADLVGTGETAVTQCTLHGNDGNTAAHLSAGPSTSITISRSLLTGGVGDRAVVLEGSAQVALSQTDIWGNEGGNWTGTIAEQFGPGENLEIDPDYCDPDNGMFSTTYDSPCYSGPDDYLGSEGGGCGLGAASFTVRSLPHVLSPIAVSCAWGDYDADGDPDLHYSMADNHIFRNDGDGVFSDVTEPNMPPYGADAYVAAWGDFDNDGDLDLVRPHRVGGADELWENQGGDVFVPVSGSGLTGATGVGWSVSVIDYDRDGWLDILSVNVDHPNSSPGNTLLYRNTGGLSFVEQVQAPLDVGGAINYDAAWCDYDNDRDLDLYLAFTEDTPDRMLVNNGGGEFTEVVLENVTQRSTNGVGWVDFDNDGWFDLFLVDYETGATLFRNLAGQEFVDVTPAAWTDYFAEGHFCMAGSWGDLDNDGYQDVFFSGQASRNALFRNHGDGTFGEWTPATLVAPSMAWCSQWVDYDLDGDLDLSVPTTGVDGVLLYTNELPEVGNWLRVRLETDRAGEQEFGSRVSILTTAGIQVREYCANGGGRSQASAVAEFGLGGLTQVAEIRVDWHGGPTEYFEAVEANQEILLIGGGAVTSLDPTIPATFAMRPCYPNPFNPMTTISFEIPSACAVDLAVFDVRGRLVKRILDGETLPAGGHEVNWAGEDHRGRRVASGSYFFALRAGDDYEVRRGTLVK
jgi:predicted outer membrane repeat protein